MLALVHAIFSYSISRPNQLPKEKSNDNNPNNFSSIKLTRKKDYMSHSYYLTPIEPSFQHLSIRPLEQTVKFVCSSLNVTNPKNPKAFKMHPQPNKLFQTYQNQLIFRLQVVTNTIQNFRQPFHICVSKVYLYLTRQYNLILLLRATSSCSAQKLF